MYNVTIKEWTSKGSDWPQGYFKAKVCKQCSVEFTPNSPCNLYCSEDCSKKGKASRYLERVYGITLHDYNVLHEKQGGVCAICKGPGFKLKECHNVLLVVDHCHTTGKIRGLLCPNCNRGLGLFQDSKDNMKEAIDYLTNQTNEPIC